MNLLWGNPFRISSGGDDAAFLGTVPVFDSLGRRQLPKIAERLHTRRFSRDEVVFRQGDPGVGLYIIKSGEIHIYREYPDLTKKRIIALRDGDFFGEIALLNDAPRTASVVAAKDTLLLCLFRSDLEDLMDTDPKLGLRLVYRLAQIVAERLRLHTEEQDI